jgi:surface protein
MGTNIINGNGKLTAFDKLKYVHNEAVKKGINSKYIKNNSINGPKYNYKLSNLDVSKIEDMSSLFENFDFKSTSVDISKWNVSNVKNMESMFANSEGFNQDLNGWKVGNVKNMKNMFLDCKDLDKSFTWLIEKDTITNGMFTGCDKYTKSLFEFGNTYKIGIKRKLSNSNREGTPIKNSNLKK